jgi:hypothetical protein
MSWKDILERPDVFLKGKLKNKFTKNIKICKIKRKRRRIRIKDKDCQFVYPSIIGSTKSEIKIPSTFSEVGECILNALNTVLPLYAKTMIFGVYIDIYIIGCLYRHKKLTWIIKSENIIYLSSHWIADTTHLFESMRYRLPPQFHNKKFNRQSFNAATKFYPSSMTKNAISLCTLGVSILQLNISIYDFKNILNFLKGIDHKKNIFKISDKQYITTTPVIYTVNIMHHCKGWKIFAPTINYSGKCNGGKRRKCSCHKVIRKILSTSDWDYNTLIANIPSKLSCL